MSVAALSIEPTSSGGVQAVHAAECYPVAVASRGHRPRKEEPLAALAARIPKSLHRRLQIHCVERGIMTQRFVADALREWLAKQSR